MKHSQPFLNYLATCSEASLQSFELARLNELANLRQQLTERLADIVEQMVEAGVQARLARLAFDRRRNSTQRPRQSSQRRRASDNKTKDLPLFLGIGNGSHGTLALDHNCFERATPTVLIGPRRTPPSERFPLASAS